MKRFIALVLTALIGGTMLTSSAAYKTAISASSRTSRITGTITLTGGTAVPITDADILADSLYVDEMIVPGEDIAIGSAIASEMGLKLVKPDVSPYALDGAEIDLDYQIRIPNGLTNLVTNGNFVNTTGWTAQWSALSAASNTLSVTADGTQAAGIAYQNTSTASVIGKVIYMKCRVRVTNASCTHIDLIVDGVTAGANQTLVFNNPVNGTWYDLSFVATQPADVTGNIAVKLAHYYATSAIANGKVMEVQEIIAIDLTARYGAGFEPTAAYMDALVATWFDGTEYFENVPIVSGTVFSKVSEDSQYFDFSDDIVPSVVPSGTHGLYEVLFTSGALTGQRYQLSAAGTASWSSKDYFVASGLPTSEPDNGDTFQVYMWESIPLGIYKINEAKRVDNYINVVAFDGMNIAEVNGRTTGSAGTAVKIPVILFNFLYTAGFLYNANIKNSLGDRLNVSMDNSTSYNDFNGWNINLTTNSIDTLAVTTTLSTLTVNIALARTTASKNTAALIQTASDALYNPAGDAMAQIIDHLVYTAMDDWDTATIATGESLKVYLKGGVKTTRAEMDAYANATTSVMTSLSQPFIVFTSMRDGIMKCCEAMGTYARMNRDGNIEILPLYHAVDRTIDKSIRYKTLVSDSLMKVGTIAMDYDGTYLSSGTSSVTMELRKNTILQYLSSVDKITALGEILADITLAEYYPFELEFFGDPSLQPGDWITIADTGNIVDDPLTMITHSTWRYRGRHTLRGVGQVTEYVKPTPQADRATMAVRADLFSNYPSVRCRATRTAYDPASVAAQTALQFTVTATGATLGDIVFVSSSISTGAMVVTANVTSTNTVTVTLFNPNASTAIDLGSSNWNVIVFKPTN